MSTNSETLAQHVKQLLRFACYSLHVRSLGAKLLADIAGSLGQKALRIRQDRTLIHRVQRGERQPNEAFRAACLEVYSIPLEAWLEPDPDAEREAETSDEAPKSGPRATIDEPLAPGQTLEKLRLSAARTERLLKGKLSDTAAASIEGRHQAALIAITKLEMEGELQNHPEFAGHKADIKAALLDTFAALGCNTAQGLDLFRNALLKHERARKASKRKAA